MNISHLSANSTQWSSTLKEFVWNLPTNYLSVFDHFAGLAIEIFLENYDGSVAKWTKIDNLSP